MKMLHKEHYVNSIFNLCVEIDFATSRHDFACHIHSVCFIITCTRAIHASQGSFDLQDNMIAADKADQARLNEFPRDLGEG